MSPGFSDPSLIREKVAADIFRQAGVPAAQTAFYKVYIDFGAGRKYCGVYTMVEIVDDTMVKAQYGEDKGNIYKPESSFLTFNQAQFEKKNNETEADYTDVKNFITALNSPLRTSDRAMWRTNLEKTFDVDHYLKYLAANNTIVNWDAYGAIAHNYYLYTAPDKRIRWIPWDHNEALKSTSTGAGGGAGRGVVSLAMTEVAASWPLLKYMAEDPVYYTKYKQHVKTFAETVFVPAKINALIDKNQALIAPFVTGSETEQKPYSYLSTPAEFTNALTALRTHVTTRSQAAADFVK
jgi:spore coat protein H